MIVNSGKWACGVCGKGVQAVCIKWIHKRFSGIRGDLLLAAHCFMCKRWDGTIQEADLAGDLVLKTKHMDV